jgi:hypothetical protein
MNRAPSLFLGVTFLSDAFHWKNHNNCSSVFDCRLYPTLNKLSSVIHEQKNSILARLKDTAPAMRFDTFVAFLTYTVCSLNLRELKASQVAHEHITHEHMSMEHEDKHEAEL